MRERKVSGYHAGYCKKCHWYRHGLLHIIDKLHLIHIMYTIIMLNFVIWIYIPYRGQPTSQYPINQYVLQC